MDGMRLNCAAHLMSRDALAAGLLHAAMILQAAPCVLHSPLPYENVRLRRSCKTSDFLTLLGESGDGHGRSWSASREGMCSPSPSPLGSTLPFREGQDEVANCKLLLQGCHVLEYGVRHVL